jgi:hypothetical protein
MGLTLLRALVVAVGLVMVVVGLAVVSLGGPGLLPGASAVVGGLVIVAAVFLERDRYRSSVAERTSDAPGPGGGEPLDAPLEPRFRPTEERFVDPTSGRPMRVWLDAASGERRYRADP